MPTPDLRALRIALSASHAVAHPAACRLSAELERWALVDAGAVRTGLAAQLGVPRAALAAALALRADAGEVAAREDERAERLGARLLTPGEDDFPAPLAILDLPPPALWIAGRVPDRPAVAVVGARRASRYGLEMSSWLARGAAEAGVTVVSGFAVGVDAAAHRGALDAADGRTVAVLGCGLDIDYPRGHRALGLRVREQGALVTEFGPGREPRGWQFPVRNRLIAGLARAVVVVEAAPRSGSLVTARLALEMGRDLLAVPGRVTDELALGPNALLADGAAPALTPADLAGAVGLTGGDRERPGVRPEPSGLGPEARALWRAATDAPATAEGLAAAAGLGIDRALAALLELEIAGHLRRLADARYVPN